MVITLNDYFSSRVELHILNEAGQMVFVRTIEEHAVDQPVRINMELASGMYVVHVKGDDGTQAVKKLVISRK